MKLTQIKIIHFGKLNDVTFNLNKDLTIFLGANEAGKSTTVAFVKQVLFGFHLRTNKSPFLGSPFAYNRLKRKVPSVSSKVKLPPIGLT